MKIKKNTQILEQSSVDSAPYVEKMKSTRDDLRSAMFSLHKATNEMKQGESKNSDELSAKIIQLKQNVVDGETEIYAIFKDIRNAKPNSA